MTTMKLLDSELQSAQAFSEKQIHLHLNLLNHQGIGLTECVIIEHNVKKIIAVGFYDDKERLIQDVEPWNGKANIYVGINPRPINFKTRFPNQYNTLSESTLKRTTEEDITHVTAVYYDIDPTNTNGHPVNEKQHNETILAVKKLQERYPGSLLMESGDGSYCFAPAKQAIHLNGNKAIFKQNGKNLTEAARQDLKDFDVRVDSVFDLSRLMKLMGTLSVKGKETQDQKYRMAQLPENQESSPNNSLWEKLLESQPDKEKLQEPHVALVDPPGEIPPKFWGILKSDDKLNKTWTGNRRDLKDSSKSGYDFSLTSQLIKREFSDQEIYAIGISFPHGRGKNGPKAYWERNIRNARQGLNRHKSLKEEKTLRRSKPPNSISARSLRILGTALFDPKFQEMPPSAFKFFAQMLKYDIGNGVTASQENIAREAGLSEGTGRACIKELNKAPWIKSSFMGGTMRGKKHEIMLPENNHLTESLNPNEWKLETIPEGYFAFSPPSPRNLAFYARCDVLLPTLESVRTLLNAYKEKNNALLRKYIEDAGGSPARLLGFILGLYLGDPWSFMWYAKRLTDSTNRDDFIYEKTLYKLRETRGYAIRRDRVVNRSGDFKKLLKLNCKEIGKANDPKYIYNHSQSLWRQIFPCTEETKCSCHPTYACSPKELCASETALYRYGHFTLEEVNGYSIAQDWISKHKGLKIKEEEYDLLTKFIWDIFIPYLIGISSRNRSGY